MKQEWIGANSIRIVALTDEQRDYMENGVLSVDPDRMGEPTAIIDDPTIALSQNLPEQETTNG